ncbi:cytochrome P450 monooxygenase [Drepanopeziza brunnea f. sp. 'multigermtubi' MB_m1]|uniref:Cytochrome P450 monooxygenase n=1 Tax=Marssonina brunnea f. sp. multigermtubi (strain MB_m1) TaxID=1072389 RepID=K1WUH0_MARBU|nr:cytochrome P450 monooxygenase [Drepanopeziza brunnea f. sp. 'multigermtubi' MB_m1]EKD16661.1 cytochrome P450 monooxygenase [Drepanopeziza brunnea f. sp. 'multigermtubi' MB_m1]
MTSGLTETEHARYRDATYPPPSTSSLNQEASCVVDYLVRATDEKGNKLPEKYRSDATLVTEGAGFVTTGSLLAWIIFSLVSYPESQERLLQELVDHGVREGPLSPTKSSPGGYRSPKDAVVIVAIHHIHNNPKIWDNPAKFTPDRWTTDKVKNRHKTAHVPFAAGQRTCIGFRFARMEGRVVISICEKLGNDPTEYDRSFQLTRPMDFYARARKRTT